MNYGEQYGYWYLRLNGFFPLSNFVIHASNKIEYSSEVDLLAIRTGFVFEEIGGQEDDWDAALLGNFKVGSIIGLVCEVKTGDFDKQKLFTVQDLEYSVGRLGIIEQEDIGELVPQLLDTSIVHLDENRQIGKLLISEKAVESESFITIGLNHVIGFLHGRVRKYPAEKYRDRMFFGSVLMQSVIDKAALNRLAS